MGCLRGKEVGEWDAWLKGSEIHTFGGGEFWVDRSGWSWDWVIVAKVPSCVNV